MSMFEDLRKSVSNRSSLSDEIFLQPIDQNYSDSDLKHVECEVHEFFDQYALQADMKGLISSLEEIETSTDCESSSYELGVKLSLTGSNLHFSQFLKENWRRSLEETVFNQKSLLTYLTSSMTLPFVYRTRAYSNTPSPSKFSLSESCPFTFATERTSHPYGSHFANAYSFNQLNAKILINNSPRESGEFN